MITNPRLLSESSVFVNFKAEVAGELAALEARASLQATNRAALKLLADMPSDTACYLSEGRRAGMFRWVTGNQSVSVIKDPKEGWCIAPSWKADGTQGAWFRADITTAKPEWWGALGDNVTNDTDAFAELGDYISANKGGTIDFRSGAIYRVGKQDLLNNGSVMFNPRKLLEITGCTNPVTLRGNGARIKFADGLRYGTFDSAGNVTNRAMPNYANNEIAAPCKIAIIHIESCSGPVVFEGSCDMDGNIANMIIGGPRGDTGWQIGGDMIFFSNTSNMTMGPWVLHHAPRDGIQGYGPCYTESAPKNNIFFNGLICDKNARQGFSILGGRGWKFSGCRFTNTATATNVGVNGRVVTSAPGAGVDLEAEVGLIRDMVFEDCEFSLNSGCACVADSGNTVNVKFYRCKFISDASVAAWSAKPRMRYYDCTFVGPVYPCYGDPNPEDATQFHDCRWTDRLTESPSGAVMGGFAVDLGGQNQNVLFNRATFDMVRNPSIFTSGSIGSTQSIFKDSKITQASTTAGIMIFSPKLEGTVKVTTNGSAIAAPGIYYGNAIFILNGTDMTRYTKTVDPASIAPGTNAYIGIDAFGRPLEMGWKPEVSFDANLAGLVMTSYVGAPDNIIIVLSNLTAAAIDLPLGTFNVRVRPLV